MWSANETSQTEQTGQFYIRCLPYQTGNDLFWEIKICPVSSVQFMKSHILHSVVFDQAMSGPQGNWYQLLQWASLCWLSMSTDWVDINEMKDCEFPQRPCLSFFSRYAVMAICYMKWVIPSFSQRFIHCSFTEPVICCIAHINVKPQYCMSPFSMLPLWLHALISAYKA